MDEWMNESTRRRNSRCLAPRQVLSELSLSDGDDDDEYGGMGDMLGQEERERLANMTELEREMEVALKEERLQQKRQRAQLLRKEKRREKEAAQLADGTMTPSEKRTQDAKRAALEQLASKKRRQTGKARKARKVDGDDDDDDVDDEEEEEEEEQGESMEDGEELFGAADGDEEDLGGDPESASYQEAKTIQVRRHKMEEWFDKPFFKSAMNGVVVRLAVGNKQVRADSYACLCDAWFFPSPLASSPLASSHVVLFVILFRVGAAARRAGGAQQGVVRVRQGAGAGGAGTGLLQVQPHVAALEEPVPVRQGQR
jgi:hypothetical protein